LILQQQKFIKKCTSCVQLHTKSPLINFTNDKIRY